MSLEWIYRNREFLVTGLVIVAAPFFLGLFAQSQTLNPLLQIAIVSTAIFLVLPLLYCKIVVRKPFSEIGLQRGSWWGATGGSLIAVSSGLVLLFVLVKFTPLLEGARLPMIVEKNFLYFILYQVFLNGWITLLLEVFFRGFVMLYWLRGLGFLAVFVQAALFSIVVSLTDGIRPETIPLLLFSPLAGLVAYQTRSIFASWGASWFFILLSDVLLLLLNR